MNKKNLIISAVILAILLIAGIVGYHYLVVLPQQEAERAEQARTRYEGRKACLEEASHRYTREWIRNCKNLGLEARCRLPIFLADNLDEMLARDERYCFEKYPLLE